MEILRTTIDLLSTELAHLWTQAAEIWRAGGWAMVAIAVIALFMFGVGAHVHLGLRAKRFRSVPEETWRHWIRHPAERRGPVGDLLDRATGGATLKDMLAAFEHLRTTEAAPFERDLKVMRVCVGAAPLVGLLGTVTGMLSTFGALSTGGGGEKTMALVAAGISEALITTETGLVIALPGLFFQYQLTRTFERYKAFLAHLETACTQSLHRELRGKERVRARNAALKQVARTLQQGLLRRETARRFRRAAPRQPQTLETI